MSNLSANQIKISKPVIEKVKMSRIVFDLHPDKKIWCFRQHLGKTAYGASYGNEYYCYGCKSELIFRWKDERESNPPFRVHEVFIEEKSRVNEYGRTVNYSYYKAYCCKCWMNNELTIIREAPSSEWHPCDCQKYINQERARYEKDKTEYSDKLNTLNDLMKQLEKIKGNPYKKWDEIKETYKDYKLDYFIRDLKKERERESSMISHCIRNLNQLNEWEYKLKENKTCPQ